MVVIVSRVEHNIHIARAVRFHETVRLSFRVAYPSSGLLPYTALISDDNIYAGLPRLGSCSSSYSVALMFLFPLLQTINVIGT